MMPGVPRVRHDPRRGHRAPARDDQAALEVNLGGTAVGTGITADPGYAASVAPPQRDHGSAARDRARPRRGDERHRRLHDLLSALKRSAMLSKICNDLRLLSSGPQAGLAEINLPPRQAGSSIMPGKVNPVIPEAVSQVAYAVAGADVTVMMAAEGGQLQLNAFEPVALAPCSRSRGCARPAGPCASTASTGSPRTPSAWRPRSPRASA